jgi:hypothetical protein
MLLHHDLLKRGVVKFMEETLLIVSNAQVYAHILLDGSPDRVDIHARAKYIDPFEAPPIMTQNEVTEGARLE